MLEFQIDNIFVVFKRIVCIQMGTNCASLPADIFFIQK